MELKLTDAGGDTMDLVDISGYRTCSFGRSPETLEKLVHNISQLECREDDIFIFAPVKSGTHWLWEISSMLINGKAETITKRKAQQMLEHELPETLDAIPSPRILNSHLNLRFLPKQLFEKKCKIIHVLRNPKDAVVSWYNHDVGIQCYGYSGKWENFLPLFLEDKLEYGSWTQYILEWEKFRKDHPNHPIFVTSYEDLHKNYIQEIRRLAKFLDLHTEETLIQEVATKCRFKHMVVDKEYSKDLRARIFKQNFTMYRKGEVGDWKNWFTVAQNEEFDRIMAEKMKNISHKFKYVLETIADDKCLLENSTV